MFLSPIAPNFLKTTLLHPVYIYTIYIYVYICVLCNGKNVVPVHIIKTYGIVDV
jgi:hypothetical protein